MVICTGCWRTRPTSAISFLMTGVVRGSGTSGVMACGRHLSAQNSARVLLAWHDSRNENLQGEGIDRWLDSMSYKEYLEREMKLGFQGAAMADLFLAGLLRPR